MQVGRYRVTRRLGRGGMAEVLEAVAVGESGFERRVAIKRLLPGVERDPVVARMFLDEARIASQLHHAGIVSVLDFGVADALPFQVHEHVHGLDARALVHRAEARAMSVPVEVALHVCLEVAHALDYAHAAAATDGKPLGIVHRDVTPSNVLVSWAGDVKLTDFGIAFATERTERTTEGVLKGKIAYMAPEQALARRVDARTDVFALGCLLHFLSTGESPLSRDENQTFLVSGGTTELGLHPGLARDVSALVAQATRHAAAQRFESAGAMADAIGRALAQRLDRDPKSMLRAWLAALHEPADESGSDEEVEANGVRSPARRGALDALLDVELVLADGTGDVRRFETRLTPSGARARRASQAPAPAAAPERSEARRRWPWAGAATALVLAGAGAIAAWQMGAISLPAAAGPARASMRRAIGPTEIAPAPPAPSARSIVEPAPAATAEPARPAAPSHAARSRDSHAARARTPESTETAPAAAWLSIGGSGALQAEIVADGHRLGFAPRYVTLPAGSHEIVLVDRTGARIASRRLVLTDRHTQARPMRWTVP